MWMTVQRLGEWPPRGPPRSPQGLARPWSVLLCWAGGCAFGSWVTLCLLPKGAPLDTFSDLLADSLLLTRTRCFDFLP